MVNGDGRASPEFRRQEPNEGWDSSCHVFGPLESPAQCPRHNTLRGSGRILATFKDLRQRD